MTRRSGSNKRSQEDSLAMSDLSPYLNRIICGDCLEVMRGIPDGSVDMIFTDPPYGHNNNNGDLISRWEAALGKGEYKPEEMNRPIANDGPEANDLFKACLPEFKRILKYGSCCCCCCSGGGGPDPQFARWSLWMDEVLEFKQMVIWDKGPMGMGWHYRRSYEVVLVAMKPGAACAWYDTSKKVENIIRPGFKGISKIIPSSITHPTPKPTGLAAHFIKLHSKPGDIIFDPFVGGGGTIEAAKRLNRQYIGIELNPDYCRMAEERIKQETAQLNMFHPPLKQQEG